MIQTRISWTDEALDEAKQAAPDCDTGFELAEVLSQRWGCKVTRKSVVRAFERAGLRVGDYLGTGDNAGPFPTSAVPSEPEPTVECMAVVRAVQRGAKTLEDLCNALDLSPRRAKVLAQQARARGYDLKIEDGSIEFDTSPKLLRPTVAPMPAAGTEADPVRLAVISDTHFGGGNMGLDELRDFITTAYSRGYRTILHAGDIFDGAYHPGQHFEIAAAGFERQSRIALDALPALPGLKYYYIIGNHDWNGYQKPCGLDPGRALKDRAIAEGRDDLVYLGAIRGRLHFGGGDDGIKVEIAHPSIRNAYAKSHPVQKYVEKYIGGDKPHLLFLGHLHSYSVNDVRNIQCFQTGCFHWDSHFEQEKNLTPSVGGFMIKVWKNERGIEVNHYYRKYWPKPVEWHEVEYYG